MMERIDQAAKDILAVFMHPGDQRYEEVLAATKARIGRLLTRPNLKGVLMELGNRLVTEHGWEPAGRAWQRVPAGNHTGLIAGLTQQLNDSQEMRELLNEFGFDWPIVETQTEKGGEA